MKTIFLYLLLFESFLEIHGDERLASIGISQVSNEPSLVSIGINQVISEYYVKRDERFDIIIIGNNTNELRDLVDDIVNVKPLNFPIQLYTISKIDKTQINRSAVVLCETYFACFPLFVRPYPFSFPSNGHFLVYTHDVRFKDRARLKKRLGNELSIQFTYLIKDSDLKIKLISLQRFHQRDCREWEETTINQMTKNKKIWETNEFFPKRFKDFKRCKLIVATHENPPYSSLIENNESETGFDPGRGFVLRINEAIADSLNFKSQYLKIDPLKELPNHDLRLRVLASRKLNFHPELLLTHPISTKRDIFLVPPGELYTPFEKLILPFDHDTWFWMIITFSSGVVTIVVLKFVPKEIRDFVCGPNVQSPLMNMAIGWFGGSQMALPRRNFARYLLMLFLLFSLIMRTAYQGVQFDLMRKELRKPIVKTVNDLLDQGFKMYIDEKELEYLNQTEFYKSFEARQLDMPHLTLDSLISQMNELLPFGYKRAMLVYDIWLSYYLNLREDNEEFYPKVLEEPLGTDFIGLQFFRTEFMYEPYKEMIARLFEAGIVGKFVRDETEVRLRSEDDGPKVLTLHDLSTSFQVWIFFVAIAGISFIIEWLIFVLHQIIRTVIIQTTIYFALPLND